MDLNTGENCLKWRRKQARKEKPSDPSPEAKPPHFEALSDKGFQRFYFLWDAIVLKRFDNENICTIGSDITRWISAEADALPFWTFFFSVATSLPIYENHSVKSKSNFKYYQGCEWVAI